MRFNISFCFGCGFFGCGSLYSCGFFDSGSLNGFFNDWSFYFSHRSFFYSSGSLNGFFFSGSCFGLFFGSGSFGCAICRAARADSSPPCATA